MPDHKPLTDEELDQMAKGYAPVPLSGTLERAAADIRWLQADNAELRKLLSECADVIEDDLEERPARHSLGSLSARLIAELAKEQP